MDNRPEETIKHRLSAAHVLVIIFEVAAIILAAVLVRHYKPETDAILAEWNATPEPVVTVEPTPSPVPTATPEPTEAPVIIHNAVMQETPEDYILTSVGYDRYTNAMVLIFNNKHGYSGVWLYKDLEEERWARMMAADSKSSYFITFIRDSYESEELTEYETAEYMGYEP